MNEATQLITLDDVTAMAIDGISEFGRQLAEMREHYDGIVYEMDDPTQNKRARSDRLAVAKVISRLDARHKEVKRPLLDATQALDGRRKEIKDELEGIKSRIKSQVDAWDDIERERIAALDARLDEIRALVEDAHALSAESLQARIVHVRDIDVGDDWQDRRADAALVVRDTLGALTHHHGLAVTREGEAAELERLRAEAEQRAREDRDREVAKEAAAKAKQEAEQAAQAARERLEAEKLAAVAAQQRAEQEARDAAVRAEEEAKRREAEAAAAERARIEHAQHVAKREAEAERVLEEKRQSRKAHRDKIHKEIGAALAGELPTDEAERTLARIVAGDIPHLSVDYS